MKLLLIPTKPAQLNMAAAIYSNRGKAPGIALDFLIASQALGRMNLEENFKLFDLPLPKAILDTSCADNQKEIAQRAVVLRDTIRSISGKHAVDSIVAFGDLDPVIAHALSGDDRHLPPIIYVDSGVRSETEPQAGWVRQRQMVEPNAAFAFTRMANGVQILKDGGAKGQVIFAGDLSDDVSATMLKIADDKSDILEKHNLIAKNYTFASIGQEENHAYPERLKSILMALSMQAGEMDIFLLVDQKVDDALKAGEPDWEEKLKSGAIHKVHIAKGGLLPVHLARLIKNASLSVTDMVIGQKMSLLARTPCIVPRQEAGWLNDGHAILMPPSDIPEIYAANFYVTAYGVMSGIYKSRPHTASSSPNAAETILRTLEEDSAHSRASARLPKPMILRY